MVATQQSDRKLYKRRVKDDENLVYYEYLLDTCGTGSVGHIRKQASIGVMSKENAAKLQRLMDEIQRSSV